MSGCDNWARVMSLTGTCLVSLVYQFHVPGLVYFFSISISASFRYPYEAIHVVTDDGYVLLLERIPRFSSILFSCHVVKCLCSRSCFMSYLSLLQTWCEESCLFTAWNIGFINGVVIFSLLFGCTMSRYYPKSTYILIHVCLFLI